MTATKFEPYSDYRNSNVAWLGDMPRHWELRTTKRIFARVQRPVRPHDGIVTAFRDGEVTLRSNRRVDGFTNAVKEIGYQGVRRGDLLVHAMDGFAGAIGISDSDGKCSPVCSVCVPQRKEQIDAPYYGYLVRQLAVTDFITSLAKGIRERSTEFRFSELSNLPLPVPPRSEQTQIAKFLDYETSRIDALIEKQQQLIELLKEKRQAVISHAVTKGLNPDAPMRDSGVEWLGEIPAHWVSCSLGKVTIKRCDGPFGSGLKSSHYTESGVRVIRLGNIKANRYAWGSDVFIDNDHYEQNLRDHSVLAGDVLVAGLGDANNHVGRACVAPEGIEPAMVKADCFRLRVDNQRVLPKFLALQLSTSSAHTAGVLANGSTRSRIPLGSMMTRAIAYCPLDEQEQIVANAEKLEQQYQRLEVAAAKQVELLQERRTALISAAVTGKIDVRNWKAPEPSDTNNQGVAA